MKNDNDMIENRTRYLPVCSVVPQPTAQPRAPINVGIHIYCICKSIVTSVAKGLQG